jgi:protein transport protein SEC13
MLGTCPGCLPSRLTLTQLVCEQYCAPPQVYAWTEGTDGEWSRKLVHDFAPHAVWKLSWSITGGILAVSDGSNATTLWKETVDGVWQQIQQ